MHKGIYFKALVYTGCEVQHLRCGLAGWRSGRADVVGQDQKPLLEKLFFLREVSLLCSSVQLPGCDPPRG